MSLPQYDDVFINCQPGITFLPSKYAENRLKLSILYA